MKANIHPVEDYIRRYDIAYSEWHRATSASQGRNQMACNYGTIKGETLNVSSMGAFIKSSEPLKFNEVFILDMDVPALDYPLKAIAEVVWLNRNGNKNEITPYGMGIRFIRISSADRRLIFNEVLKHLNSENVETGSSVVFRTTAADQEVESGEAI